MEWLLCCTTNTKFKGISLVKFNHFPSKEHLFKHNEKYTWKDLQLSDKLSKF